MKEFGVFILTHGRAKNVLTYKILRRHGYTGKIHLLIDNEDDQQDEYIKEYGDQVIVFNKKATAGTFDVGDNFDDLAAVVYARNACFDIARNLGYKYFLELDDDYSSFIYKFTPDGDFLETNIYSLDNIFKYFVDFMRETNTLDLTMAQNGDFIGGKNGGIAKDIKIKRKAMNTHFLSTERQFPFLGKINEDVNSPVSIGSRGGLFFTVPLVSIIQKATQSNSGGLTDIYLDRGTYIKSFYSVLFSPSCVKISIMGDSHLRLHHQVRWKNAVPVIIREEWKK